MNRVEKMITERNRLINELLNGKPESKKTDVVKSQKASANVVVIWSGYIAKAIKERLN